MGMSDVVLYHCNRLSLIMKLCYQKKKQIHTLSCTQYTYLQVLVDLVTKSEVGWAKKPNQTDWNRIEPTQPKLN